MKKYVCIHGHFYQPPRENPWLEEVEYQDSAYPYHDWNERVSAECYAPNTASRIIAADGSVMVIGNNYTRMNFNFGPTLLSWMQRRAPETYTAIIAADRASCDHFSGHGSAMAQAYNHLIMPLANTRDKRTQIAWGIYDFEHRFQRKPEGMWLPETAVDTETLELLVEAGILFTVLSPHQARRFRKKASAEWTDVTGGKIDPRVPYSILLPSGKSIAVFFYDGHIAQDVAFGGLLRSGEDLARRLLASFPEKPEMPQLAHIATDGETFGHHHKYGDMALAYGIHYIETQGLATITNYPEFLAKYPPVYEAEIFENSSWSCVHGVERWKSNCGCNSGAHPGWHQEWRKPLRESLDWLRDALIPVFEQMGTRFFENPWRARDQYIRVILERTETNLDIFFQQNARAPLSPEDRILAIKLLEMQRYAQLMYTSCGWFFDEVSGIETVQILQYACRAIQLAAEVGGQNLESEFIERLKSIPTNVPEYQNGARIYTLFATTAKVDFLRLGAHYAISALFENYPDKIDLYSYTAHSDLYDKRSLGKTTLLVTRTHLTSKITFEKTRISAVVLHLGDHNINCGVRYFSSDGVSHIMHNNIVTAYIEGNIFAVLKYMEKDFNQNNYSLVSLFKDEQKKVLNKIIEPFMAQSDVLMRQIWDTNYLMIDYFKTLNLRVPRNLLVIMGCRAEADLEQIFSDMPDLEALTAAADEIRKWGLEFDRPRIGLIASSWVNEAMTKLAAHPDDTGLMRKIEKSLILLTSISIPMNLWKSQNIYYDLDSRLSPALGEKSSGNGKDAAEWLEAFHALGGQLQFKVSS